MICDGYNRVGVVNGDDHFVYRAFSRHERKALWEELKHLPAHIAEKWERQIVEQRIVVADFDCAVLHFDDETYRTVAMQVFGFDNDDQEIADEKNLADFVYLRERWPWLANTSCASCRKYLYDPVDGKLFENNVDGEMQPLHRPEGYPLLCEGGACPKGHWKNPVELSEKNRLALQYCETTTGGDDPIVQRNRRVIEDAIDRARADAEADGRAKGRSPAPHQPRRHGLGRGRTGAGGRAGRVGRASSAAGDVA